MRRKAKGLDDPWKTFLRYFDERTSAGAMLRELLSHLPDQESRRNLLEEIAEYARFYVLDEGALGRGRQKRKQIETRLLKSTRRSHEEYAEHYRMAEQNDELKRSKQELASLHSAESNLKEAFDSQRLGRRHNHLPIIVLRRLVQIKSGAQLKAQDLAWILEAAYCAWGRVGCQDVDAETLGKNLSHFEKRNPIMMAQISERYPLPESRNKNG